MTELELKHYGILGQKWGIRRYQNKDGSLTAAGKAKQQSSSNQLSKADTKWVSKNSEKITETAKKKSSKELNAYASDLLSSGTAFNKNGKLSSATITAYNKKMASLMNEQVSGLTSPSGKVIQFVAKRGETGVFLALADQGYDISQLNNGIYDSGKVAYRKTVIDKV